MFNKNNVWAIEGNAQIKLDVNMTLSEAVAVGATLVAKLNKGYKLCDQFGGCITKERVIKMINVIANRCSNVLTDNWVIKLSSVVNKTNRYTNKRGGVLNTNMGAIHAQLINIKGLFEKIDYTYTVEVYDEDFRSAGMVDLEEHQVSYLRCLLDNKLTIVTDNVELFNSYYDYGVWKPSIVKCYKHFINFVYIKSLNDLRNEANILYKLGATINTCTPKQICAPSTQDSDAIEVSHNMLKLLGMDYLIGSKDPEAKKWVEEMVENWEYLPFIDTTMSGNTILNTVLKPLDADLVSKKVARLVEAGHMSLEEDVRAYQDSTEDDVEIIDESTIEIHYNKVDMYEECVLEVALLLVLLGD